MTEEKPVLPAETQPAIDDAYYDKCPPPPAYMEAVGMEDNPITYAKSQVPPLSYMDFQPLHEHEKYPDLINRANIWLSANPVYKVISCESVKFAVKNGIADSTNSLTHCPSNGVKYYIRALRLWLTPRSDSNESVQILGTISRVPDRINKQALREDAMTNFLIGGRAFATMAFAHQSVFQPFSSCLSKLNSELEENPLPGRVMRIETQEMKVTETFGPVELDPDKLHWSERETTTMFASVLRIIYIQGPPAHERLEWRDIIPVFIPEKSSNRPHFEPFTQTLYKAGHWIHAQKDIRITNIQTLDTRVQLNMFDMGSQRRVIMDTNRVEFNENFLSEYMYVRFLRVCYVKSPEITVPAPYCLTQRSFLPYQISRRQFESPAENINRAGVWMDINTQMSAISVNQIICTETIQYEHQMESKRDIDLEKTTYVHHKNFGHYYVTGVRLFINGMFIEPHAQYLPPAPVQVQSTSSGCCTLI